MNRLLRSHAARAAAAVVVLGGAGALVWWHGPDWGDVVDAFTFVDWHWVLAAVGLNLLSVVARSLAWQTVIAQAMPPPHPRYPLVFSAFSVGLLANAVLPGRVGELARVAVLTRRLPGREGLWATLVGSVFAHRVFDLVPVVFLVGYVLWSARIPHWAYTSLIAILVIGCGLFLVALAAARRHQRSALDGLGRARRLVTMTRHGLGVMHEPLQASAAILFQLVGWLCQLLAVWTAMRAFNLDLPLPAAGLVLVLMNVATILPLWPGNVGLVQAAIALPLIQYGVAYPTGFAYGLGLQAIEASVGIGVGLAFLAREGITFAVLRKMPEAAHVLEDERRGPDEARERKRARAGVPG